MNTLKHISTIYFYHKTVIDSDLSGKETDVLDTYEIYRDSTEMTIKKEDTVIMTSYPTILFIDVLKKIGYQETDPVYWDFSSYCYDGWDITDIMKRPMIKFPDKFEFFIGDTENGISYNITDFK